MKTSMNHSLPLNFILYVDQSKVSQDLVPFVTSVWSKIENLVVQAQLYISRNSEGNAWFVSKKDGTCSFQSDNLEVAVLQSWSFAQNN